MEIFNGNLFSPLLFSFYCSLQGEKLGWHVVVKEGRGTEQIRRKMEETFKGQKCGENR